MNGLIPREDAVLVIVDIQEKLFRAIEGRDNVLTNTLKVIEFARRLEMPILVTEQYPRGLAESLPEIKEALGDLYVPIPKTAFSCFGEPAFVEALKEQDRSWVVLAGIETHVCVAQTAITGLNYYIDSDDDFDFSVAVLADCVGARKNEYHEIGIGRMRDEGAVITNSDAFFYEMLTEAKTDDHKKVFDLLK